MDINDQVVVITGAGKGLGHELALQLAKEKVKLALISRTESDLKKLSSDIKRLGNECEYFVCDVSDERKVKETVEKIIKSFNKIDILINNAGIWWEGPVDEIPEGKSKELFDTVSLGTIYFTNSVLPYMRKQNGGQIFNVISQAGIETPGENGQYAEYTAAKFAITGFTKSVEEELKDTNIKVIGFYPGGMNTEIFRSAGFNYSDNEDWMMDKKDVAEIIVFILKRPKDVLMDHVVVKKK